MRGSRLLFACLLCPLILALFPAAAFSQDFDDLEVGEPVPDFTLPDLAEREYTLSDLEGEIVVIQFGSSTTRPFLEQIEPMNELVRKYRRDGVTFLAVYTEEQSFGWQAEDYFSKYQRAKGLRMQYAAQSGQRLDATILVDDLDGAVYKAYGSVPAGVFIVDEDGNLAFKARVLDVSEVDEALEDLM